MATKKKTAAKVQENQVALQTETPEKVKPLSLKKIQAAANTAWDMHLTKQHNESWMLQEIAANNPGLVYYWNPINLGYKLKKSAVDVNKLLENMGFQTRINKVWTLTSQGEKYAVLRPFEVKHEGAEYPVSGQQILWSIDVLPLIRAWLKGSEKPTTPTLNPSADMSNQQLVEELLKNLDKTFADEFSIPLRVEMELEQAQELAMKYFVGLCKHWKMVTAYARPRKQGCTIQIKVQQPKVEPEAQEVA
jgi:hypothetical protein